VCDETHIKVSPVEKTDQVDDENEPLKEKLLVSLDSEPNSSLVLSVPCDVSPVDRSHHGSSEHDEQMESITGKNSVDPNICSESTENDSQMERPSTYKHTADSNELSDSVHHSPSPTKSSSTAPTTQPSRNSGAMTCDVTVEHNDLERMDPHTHADGQMRSLSYECDKADFVRTPLHKKPKIEPPVCGLESCSKLCEKKKNGTYFPYCTKKHRNLAVQRSKRHKPALKKESICYPTSNDDCFVEEDDSADIHQNDSSKRILAVAQQTPTTSLSPVPKQPGAMQQPPQREDAPSKGSKNQLTCCSCSLLLTSEDELTKEKFCIDCRKAQITMIQDEEELAESESYLQSVRSRTRRRSNREFLRKISG
jgi:hypothetical protein